MRYKNPVVIWIITFCAVVPKSSCFDITAYIFTKLVGVDGIVLLITSEREELSSLVEVVIILLKLQRSHSSGDSVTKENFSQGKLVKAPCFY